jgi:hypothetical protein
MDALWGEEISMEPDRQREVDQLYKKAQKILLHELTEDEHQLVSSLAFENHATLPDAKLSRLKDLVKKKGTRLSSPS